MKKRNNSYLFLYVYALALVVIDQITKIIVKTNMDYGESISILGDFFRLTYIENPGMAFGIHFGGRWFFAIFSLLASIGLIIYIYKIRKSHWSVQTALVLILGGAAGNLIDRFLFGRVVDFFDVDFFDIPAFNFASWSFHGMARWPVFNMADSYVSVGMVILIIYMYYEEKLKKSVHSEADTIES